MAQSKTTDNEVMRSIELIEVIDGELIEPIVATDAKPEVESLTTQSKTVQRTVTIPLLLQYESIVQETVLRRLRGAQTEALANLQWIVTDSRMTAERALRHYGASLQGYVRVKKRTTSEVVGFPVANSEDVEVRVLLVGDADRR